MNQKDLFDDEEGKFEGDELEDLRGKLNQPKKGKTKLLLVIGLLLVAGAYAANLFLSKQEEPGAPTVPPQRIPIKGAPAMGVITGVNAVLAPPKEVAKKEEPKVKAEKKVKEAVKTGDKKTEVKPEAKKIEEVKIAKKEEAPKPKPEVKAEKPAPKEGVKAEVKKAEAMKPAEVKVTKKKTKAATKREKETPKKFKKERFDVVVGTYAARYGVEEAQELLKSKGIRYASREIRKKLTMNRIFIKEVKNKEEARVLLSELKRKGYEPFSILANSVYSVYAISNMSDEIAKENKADLEKLGYEPVIEKKLVEARVYELIARAKSERDAEALVARLKKMGFKPDTIN